MSEYEPQEPTQGQLEHLQKQIDAGEWTDEVEVGAQKIQDEVNAGRAEVIGTGAAVVALGEIEQKDLIELRKQDKKVAEHNDGLDEKDKLYTLRDTASSHRIDVRLDPNDKDNKGIMEAENIGAALIDEAVDVRGTAKVADGAYLGAGSFVGHGAEVGENVELGDVYVGGKIGEGSKIKRGTITHGNEVGKNVDASTGAWLQVKGEGQIGDNVKIAPETDDPTRVNVFGPVGEGATLGDGVTVHEAYAGNIRGEVAPGEVVPPLTTVKGEPRVPVS